MTHRLDELAAEFEMLGRLGGVRGNASWLPGIAAGLDAHLLESDQAFALYDFLVSVAEKKPDDWDDRWPLLRGGWSRNELFPSAVYACAFIEDERLDAWLANVLRSRLLHNVVEGWEFRDADGALARTVGIDTYNDDDVAHLHQRLETLQSMPSGFWNALCRRRGNWGKNLERTTNPMTPSKWLSDFITTEVDLRVRGDSELLTAVAMHPRVDADTFAMLIERPPPWPQRSRQHHRTSIQAWAMVALNKQASANVLETLAPRRDRWVRAAVAANPATPPETLARIATDNEGLPRLVAATNPSLPDEVCKWLAQCGSADVENRARQNPALSALPASDGDLNDSPPDIGPHSLEVALDQLKLAAKEREDRAEPLDDGDLMIWPEPMTTSLYESMIVSDHVVRFLQGCACGNALEHSDHCIASSCRLDKQTLRGRRMLLAGTDPRTGSALGRADWIDAVAAADLQCVASGTRDARYWRFDHPARVTRYQRDYPDAAQWLKSLLEAAIDSGKVTLSEFALVRARSVASVLCHPDRYGRLPSILPAIDVLPIEGGLALVVPATVVGADAWSSWLASKDMQFRQYISRWLHIQCAVVSCGLASERQPSERRAAQVLLIARADVQDPRRRRATRFVWRDAVPASTSGRRALASKTLREYATGGETGAMSFSWPAERMVDGDWPSISCRESFAQLVTET